MSYIITAATNILELDLLHELKESLYSIPQLFSAFNSYLPKNRFARLIIYGSGVVLFMQCTPIIFRNTEIFAYHFRYMEYFHRGCPQVNDKKEELLAELKDNSIILPKFNENLIILEINAGGGANLTYYPDNTVLLATDHDESYGEKLLQNFESETSEAFISNMTLNRFIHTHPEELYNIPDNSVSVVVCIHSLCQARSLERALAEIKRVLLPGGRFYFLEHVQEFKMWSYEWFSQMKFLISFAFVWCHVGRPTQYAIQNAGFTKVNYQKFRADFSKVATRPILALEPHIYGVCVK